MENGRKGGEARAKKYLKKINHVITLFVRFPNMNQMEIANQANVSQAFVSKHTNYVALKISRLSAAKEDVSEEELNNLLLKVKLEIELREEIKRRGRVKL
jgi:predicted XRE-type DNA-binding protein